MSAPTPRQLRLTAYDSIRKAASLLLDAAAELEMAGEDCASTRAYYLHSDACALKDRLTPQRRKRKAAK